MDASLEVKDIVSGYEKDIDIIRGVSLEAHESSFISIIGPNGSGKSTFLKTIFGYLSPKKGKILYNGNDITHEKPFKLLKLGIGYLPQERSIFTNMTVRENLELGAWIFKDQREKVERAIQDVFERFPILKERENTKVYILSGGEQRMLELGRALLVKPKILMLDEPCTALAPKLADEIHLIMKKLNKEEGITIILVDQNVKKAVELGEFIYVLELGKITAHGSREEFSKDLRRLIKSWLV